MSILILKPSSSIRTYQKATEIFVDMYRKVTGVELQVGEADDGVSDLVVIGSDAVSNFLADEILDGEIDSLKIKYGTDDYCIRSYMKGSRRILILAGGRGRSTVYAVYDFFERFADCHYFWDGDVINSRHSIEYGDCDIVESPRFEYRGLRYFAHRGLKRFQAEHWSIDDWRRELDYLSKKRLNFFMLRIGMDDVWQRAFPDLVPYADDYFNMSITDGTPGYDNRSDFWTLRYRGELRKQILEYARELDMIYPTDCGTMTHWYSRTPVEYLKEKQPLFLGQVDKQYNTFDTGKVWDFRIKENMDDYMHLTETMVNEYEKSSEYFHTIGLGERMMIADRKKNTTLKLLCYRRITESLRERYPNSKLFIASWDFIGWWRGEEVQKLIGEFDPQRTIILDYTSDADDPEQTFLNWGVVGKFPWVFGLFHAYEPESELRGPFDRSDERLRVAASDPFCRGMIFWPELSHSDPIILEYLAENSWSPLEKTLEELVEDFCYKRYGAEGEQMNMLWQDFLPFMKLSSWGGYSKRDDNDEKKVEYYNSWYSHSDIWNKPITVISNSHSNIWLKKQFEMRTERALPYFDTLADTVVKLGKILSTKNDEFISRDVIDIIRTIVGRCLNFLYAKAIFNFDDKELINAIRPVYFELLDGLSELLYLSDDFSMYATLKALWETAPTNPDFERTLKENIGCDYCRQYCYEQIELLYKKETEAAFDWMLNHSRAERPDLVSVKSKIKEEYMNTSLESIANKEKADVRVLTQSFSQLLLSAKKILS